MYCGTRYMIVFFYSLGHLFTLGRIPDQEPLLMYLGRGMK